VGILSSEPTQHSGAWPDFKGARSAASEGNLREAIRFTREELKKEPENYEGLMLLASLYVDEGSPEKAIESLGTILRCSNVTDEQRRSASEQKQKVALIKD